MKTIVFSIHISASKERVWRVLWDDESFRDWGDLIDEGMYMRGALVEGSTVEFMSSVNGYGVTSLVKTLRPNDYVLFSHAADTQESGQLTREDEWTGGQESYSLKEQDGMTHLEIQTDIPEEKEETFEVRLPKALERIKYLAEREGA
ncbi:SRPBCC domain-containing protein [Paenalkalicoccus suaedae]|uniref:SRPBCC domain-containing protein n=1 Tax=Paenalkalicoccus suaedae TaxID=2592382 RepID=A0A859FE36_9BACI|nr:SRPBCC domain-containing protein [Paenalkalicoccus suaedae]QKS70486.1 SRPBCC domain-containing protein [Paenalkalicoccus suaedae]